MLRSFLQIDMLREGRNIRMPIMMVFYNSILAFLTILFIFFNNESMQVGYFTGRSSFFTQFLIISSFQILIVFFMMPFSVGHFAETEKVVARQFFMIPGVVSPYLISKMFTLVMSNLLIFISSLPIVSLSCIYSGISLWKLIRLFGMILIFSFWSSSIALFFYGMNRRFLVAFGCTMFTYFLFSGGSLLFLEIIRNTQITMGVTGELSRSIRFLCLFVNLFNPITVYMAYFGNLSGNIAMVSSYFGNFGIDATSTRFSFIYYKAATITSILVGILFLYLAVRFFYKDRRLD